MLTGLPLLLLIASAIAFIVIACARFNWHPFLALLVAALATGLLAGLPVQTLAKIANEGFGGMMTHIGLIVVLGTLIGTVLEKTGATLTIADAIIRFFGKDKPVLAITVIGAIVGIPIFCDSGFVILNGLTRPLCQESRKSYVAIVSGLSGGLYITHSLLPPHPGALAGAANLGLTAHLGLVILNGLLISVPTTLVGWWFCTKILSKQSSLSEKNIPEAMPVIQLPALRLSLLPVLVPVLLIAGGSLTALMSMPAWLSAALGFLGSPVIAILAGFLLALPLVRRDQRTEFKKWMREGIGHAGPILILVGAGGVFGNVLKQTPLTDLVQQWIHGGNFAAVGFLLVAFAIGSLLKTAQGSTTSAIILATSILAPVAAVAGFSQPLPLTLLLSATASGAMMVSHTNDAYFWVISQFSELTMQETYRSFSLLSAVLGLTAMACTILVALVVL